MPMRFRYFAGHLLISAAVIGAFIAFILLVWYPGSLAALEGIYPILILMTGVDVALGPLCTAVAAAPQKPRRELVRDLAIIGCVQLGALGYGLYTAAIGRPVFVVYSFGQFDVEHASQITDEELAQGSSAAFRARPWLGPVFVEGRLPADAKDAANIVQSTMNGGPAMKDLPRTYLAWPQADSEARKRVRDVAQLPDHGELKPLALTVLARHGLTANDGAVLPIVTRNGAGNVVLQKPGLQVLAVVDARQ